MLAMVDVNARNVSMPCHNGNNICQQLEPMCDNKHQELPLGSILKATRGIPENAKKSLQAIPVFTTCSESPHPPTPDRLKSVTQ